MSRIEDALGFQIRPAEQYGRVGLSVQASGTHYCSPRTPGLDLSEYDSVEVGFLLDGGLSRPSAAGIQGFDDLFEDGSVPVAGYVSQADLARLREAVRAAAV